MSDLYGKFILVRQKGKHDIIGRVIDVNEEKDGRVEVVVERTFEQTQELKKYFLEDLFEGSEPEIP
jgi:hypothetical protein